MIQSPRSVALAIAALVPSVAFAGPPAPLVDAQKQTRTYSLYDGSAATLGPDGLGWRTDKDGRRKRPVAVNVPQRLSALDGDGQDDLSIVRQLSLPRRPASAARVVVSFESATLQGLRTGDAGLDRGLAAVGARSARPVGSLPRTWVLEIAGDNPVRAAARLRALPGVVSAQPDFYVSSMATEPRALPDGARSAIRSAAAAAAPVTPVPGLPSNYGLTSSLQAHLNASGVAATGAFVEIAKRFGQLPGQGIRITNVSVGDLTDQSMADAGDGYVQYFGPTTTVVSGQRYLDYPSLPLIPTFTVAPDGTVDPLGAVEHVDPYLSEILLDFSVMAPLPHDQQRPSATASGDLDLLGIAPGAQYRLVVPQEPTISNIFVALLAAAQQTPRPDVITASLGFGFDSTGFPGRYLEEDPVGRAVVEKIVHQYGIVVCISANDGTRLFTPAAVGPDGGSAPTDRVREDQKETAIADVAFTTVPSRLPDSGAIDVGGTTLDDIFSAPPQSDGPLKGVGQFPATRLNGSGGFSSGFGTRVNLAAPSDGIVSLLHQCKGFGSCTPQDAIPVLSGGTSASAPMVAAAAAVVLQVAHLTHRDLSPAQVRELLVRTARPVAQAPQSRRPLHVGPQLDVTAAVEVLLSGEEEMEPSIVRFSIAHRQPLGDLGTAFLEATDPLAIDLSGPVRGVGTGQNATGPITFTADVVGLPHLRIRSEEGDGEESGGEDGISYALTVGKTIFASRDRTFRLLPAAIAAAAGLPLQSSSWRKVPVTYQVRRGGRVLASAYQLLGLGPTDGTWVEPLAPAVAPTAPAGADVRVRYDLSSVRARRNAILFVSSIGHYSPVAAPLFRMETTIPLDGSSGEVVVPASAFKAGAGVCGIGIQKDASRPHVGEIAVIRIGGERSSGRAQPPLFSGHYSANPLRSAPKVLLHWDASEVDDADGAILEVSAPAPTLRNSYNTFTNQNGDRRDQNGVETPSTVLVTLPSERGTQEIDLLALGLQSSMFYGARILATRHGQAVGEASAASALQFDDGVIPGNALLVDFDVSAAGPTVAVTSTTPDGNLQNSLVLPYAPATGTFGAPLVSDPTGQTQFTLVGSDPSLHSVLALAQPWDGSAPWLQTFDLRSGAQTSSVTLDPSAPYVYAGRVDPVRHRAALLGIDWNTGDWILPFDLTSNVLKPGINADDPNGRMGIFGTLDIDTATGRVLPASAILADTCVVRTAYVGSVNLDDGTAALPQAVERCTTGIAAGEDGQSAWLLKGPLFSWPHLLPVATLEKVDESSLAGSPLLPLHSRSPLFPAVDPVNHLVFAAFVAGDDFYLNNNATSAVGAWDTRTGERVFYSTAFNFAMTAFGGTVPFLATERGIQLDPATRSGFTYGPGGQQLQQFRY